MRTDTVWQGERRAARMHWWRLVLDRPTPTNGEDTFDEMLRRRFGSSPEMELLPGVEPQCGLA